MKKRDISENPAKHAYLAIGSNLGNKINNIEKVKFELENYNIKILNLSSYYLSESWPDPLRPNYINFNIKVKTILVPTELLDICNLIELKFGRIRNKRNAPRTCDIDIIDFDKKILNEKNKYLILPHPRMSKRNFVLLPLFEVEKSWKHPKSKINIVNLINSLPVKDLRSIKRI